MKWPVESFADLHHTGLNQDLDKRQYDVANASDHWTFSAPRFVVQ